MRLSPPLSTLLVRACVTSTNNRDVDVDRRTLTTTTVDVGRLGPAEVLFQPSLEQLDKYAWVIFTGSLDLGERVINKQSLSFHQIDCKLMEPTRLLLRALGQPVG